MDDRRRGHSKSQLVPSYGSFSTAHKAAVSRANRLARGTASRRQREWKSARTRPRSWHAARVRADRYHRGCLPRGSLLRCPQRRPIRRRKRRTWAMQRNKHTRPAMAEHARVHRSASTSTKTYTRRSRVVSRRRQNAPSRCAVAGCKRMQAEHAARSRRAPQQGGAAQGLEKIRGIQTASR